MCLDLLAVEDGIYVSAWKFCAIIVLCVCASPSLSLGTSASTYQADNSRCQFFFFTGLRYMHNAESSSSISEGH